MPQPTPDLWRFADRFHPVYDRPPDATRWPVPLEGMRATGYVPWMVSPRVDTQEPLSMTTEGHPSVRVYEREAGGSTIQRINLNTSRPGAMDNIDLEALKGVCRGYIEFLRTMSTGPYSLAQLRSLGHPYGYPGNPPAQWGNLGKPRGNGQMFRKGWAVKKIRGFVPPLSVINKQSGDLERAWGWSIAKRADGVTLSFYNTMPYMWFLSHGTVKMVAHAPWKEAVDRFLPTLQLAWRRAVREANVTRAASAALFGEELSDGVQPNRPGG